MQGRSDHSSVSGDDCAERRWPITIVAVHWTAGLLAFAVAGFAIYLLSPPDWSPRYIDRYMALIGWHKFGGLLVFGLALFWAVVRRHTPRPSAVGGRAARIVHGTLLVLLIALPVSGYVMDAFVNAVLELPIGMSIPSPLTPNETASIALSYAHKWGGFAFIGIAAAHAAAAIGHAMRPGDRVLRAMAPNPFQGKRSR